MVDDPEIYLDNAATTRPDRDLADYLARDMVTLFANPSSPHRPGLAARRRLEESRRDVERAVGAGLEATFTGSGSEAINLALKGAFARRRKDADRILVSAVEHHAVLHAVRDLEPRGARVEHVAVEADGRIDMGALEKALSAADDVAIVSVMQVQNELGSLNPLAAIGRLVRAKAPRAIFIVDAVQGLGKVAIDPRAWQADAVAIASHKIHGPKGVGALLRRKDLELEAQVSGGGQERGLRSGTENVAAIAAFGKAVRRAVDTLEVSTSKLADLRGRLLSGLRAEAGDVTLNGPEDPAHASPAILNVSFRGVPSELLLHCLEGDKIYVSAGSACQSSKAKSMSHVHRACGHEAWRAESAVRFGLSWHTKGVEIDRAIERTAARVKELRKLTSGG